MNPQPLNPLPPFPPMRLWIPLLSKLARLHWASRAQAKFLRLPPPKRPLLPMPMSLMFRCPQAPELAARWRQMDRAWRRKERMDRAERSNLRASLGTPVPRAPMLDLPLTKAEWAVRSAMAMQQHFREG